MQSVVFSETVKSIQARKGSRSAYARVEEDGGWQADIPPVLANFIAEQRSFFLATASADGQPYIQHRGGPRGFLKVIDNTTLAFADYKGNKQFISQGNLQENPKAYIFLIDYENRIRYKIWGTAQVIEGKPGLEESLMPDAETYRAKPEQVIMFKVGAVDRNCPQHIPQRFEREDVEKALTEKDARIASLEARLAQLEGTAEEASVNPVKYGKTRSSFFF